MTHPRSAFGAPPRGGTASGPAKHGAAVVVRKDSTRFSAQE
jgi:hypothetical protein